MTLTQRIDNTVKHHVNVKSGAGELIDYTHVELQETIRDLMVFPQTDIFEHLNEERIKQSVKFMAVFLDNRPEKNDLITYDGNEYKVELFNGRNPYDILCYKKQNAISTRTFR